MPDQSELSIIVRPNNLNATMLTDPQTLQRAADGKHRMCDPRFLTPLLVLDILTRVICGRGGREIYIELPRFRYDEFVETLEDDDCGEKTLRL
jgi:hypothetical protein